MISVMADAVSVRGRFARSANVERDLERLEPLDGYVVTGRVLDVVRRMAETARSTDAGGAWSLTGPYGSGKSSLALLIDAVFGPAREMRRSALRLIRDASPETEAAVRAAHARHGTGRTGFHRGLVTASREPLSATVLRALRNACERAPKTGGFSSVDRVLGTILQGKEDVPPTAPSTTSVIQLARALAEDRPLLLVIDEFGKNLEAVGDDEEDPYLLQQLAEAGQGSGLPIFLVTLQHLSFERHVAGGGNPARLEWEKVQGRFEDVSFAESHEQVRALIGTVFETTDAEMTERIAAWAVGHARTMSGLGITALGDAATVASYYPLHPLTAMVLPELCSRYGQHERTLFSFLTSPDPASASTFLATTDVPDQGDLPSLGLEAVYDYFVGNGLFGIWSHGQPSRWSEVVTRLRDATGLSGPETRMAKRVAVLNLISTAGVIRASEALLALTDPEAKAVLESLEAAGIVTYRDFADEYRVWQGTDVDIGRLIEDARGRIGRQPLVEVLAALDSPTPAVAARHSAEKDMLRVFRRRYADAAVPAEPVSPSSKYDGEVLLIVDSIQMTPCLADAAVSAKPVVAAIPQGVSGLEEAAREVLAVRMSIEDPLVVADWVARRELGERLAQAKANFDATVHETFRGDRCRWILVEPSGAKELPSGPGSVALSCAADMVFEGTPIIRNEVLNRTDLTSQGAKARRVLIAAMLQRGNEPGLGLEGYGPEVAMYKALLQQTRIHQQEDGGDSWSFGPPPAGDSSAHAWEVVQERFVRAKSRRVRLTEVYSALLSRPVGMKEAVIPVFVTAALLASRDEIAIYEHGTFRPLLSADVSERMVRNPQHFDIKHFANTTGARRLVLNALARRLTANVLPRQFRVANVVAIAGELVSRIRNLDQFTLQTGSLGSDARASRDAIMEAVEPDELLFDGLPDCLGLPAVRVDASRYRDGSDYADRLGKAMDELRGRYAALVEDLVQELLGTAAEKSRLALSGQAAALDGEVLDPAVRAFVLALKGQAAKTDGDWISTIGTVLCKKAPTEWTDRDLVWFKHELRGRVEAFQRLMALHVKNRSGGRGGFDAFRVTITRPDGREHDRLVAIDEKDKPLADELLADTLMQLRKNLGSQEHAEKALLACLAGRLLPQANEGELEPMPRSKIQGGRHA